MLAVVYAECHIFIDALSIGMLTVIHAGYVLFIVTLSVSMSSDIILNVSYAVLYF
jgi:hypothetical protein